MPTSAIVEVSCPFCGPVALPTGSLSCGLDPDGSSRGLCQFNCPVCARTVFLSTGHRATNVLLDEGARPFAGPAPFELLEAHEGAALTYDDILEFHSAISAAPFPQSEMMPAVGHEAVPGDGASTNGRRTGRLRTRRGRDRT